MAGRAARSGAVVRRRVLPALLRPGRAPGAGAVPGRADGPRSSFMTQNLSTRARRARPGMILTFICLGQLIVFIDVSIVNLALPSIQRGLHIDRKSTRLNSSHLVISY